MADHYTINSDASYGAFIAKVSELYQQHKYITFDAPRIGEDRSLSQNALFHLWVYQFAGHLAGCSSKEVDEASAEGLKKRLKDWYYRAGGKAYMIEVIRCPLTGEESKQYRSTAKLKRGEMFEFMEWVQNFAATRGLILESRGQYAKLKRSQYDQ